VTERIEPGVTRICRLCQGSGQETVYRSDPANCGNCAWGDCDYGHPFKVLCIACNGTGIVPFDSTRDAR
jgi:RecJ-like exonuclease